jgi:hypothetical protein
MVGDLLEEELHKPGLERPLRLDYLEYDAIAGQWRYVSIETRAPVPPMSAPSFGRDAPERITLCFEPFLRSRSHPAGRGACYAWSKSSRATDPITIPRISFFILADGSGIRWLAHRYDYRRQH